jgi:O-antigen/teichoic acid export membrane protein
VETIEQEVASHERPLGQVVTRALGWSTVGQVINRLGTFAAGIVLARLLTPDDFGVFAAILVVINVLMTVNDIGIIGAVVRWHGDVRNATGTALGIVASLSVAFYALLYLGAPAFAGALGIPQAVGMLRVVALVVVVDGISGVSQALLLRSFRQSRMLVAESVGTVVYIAVAIFLASGGHGPWSIVWARLLGTVVTGGLMFAFAPIRGPLNFDRQVARELIRFGLPQAGAAIMTEGLLNVDYLIVGHVLGAAPLGIYLLAFNLSSWPTSMVGLAVGRVAFASFARLVEDRRRLVEAFPRTIGVAVAGILPLVLMLGVLGPEVIRFVYGDKWLPAITALRFLLVLGALRIVIELLGNLVSADGRPKVNLGIRFLWLVVLIPVLLVGANIDGIRGVGIGHMLVVLGLVLPLFVRAVGVSGIRPSALWHHSWRALAAAAAAGAVMILLLPVAQGLFRVAIAGAAGMAVYCLVLVPANPLVGWVARQVRPRPTESPAPA